MRPERAAVLSVLNILFSFADAVICLAEAMRATMRQPS
jgi:hypothetical protein